jgi:hypothetical protein
MLTRQNAPPHTTAAHLLSFLNLQERLSLDRIVSALSLPSPSSSSSSPPPSPSSPSRVFVVLVDLQHLRCTRCPVQPNLLHVAFAGHYVVVHGYDAARKELLYLDPSTASSASFGVGVGAARELERKGMDGSAFSNAASRGRVRSLTFTTHLSPQFLSPRAAQCAIRLEDFERARSSNGTDDDVLEVPWPPLVDVDVAKEWEERQRQRGALARQVQQAPSLAAAAAAAPAAGESASGDRPQRERRPSQRARDAQGFTSFAAGK